MQFLRREGSERTSPGGAPSIKAEMASTLLDAIMKSNNFQRKAVRRGLRRQV